MQWSWQDRCRALRRNATGPIISIMGTVQQTPKKEHYTVLVLQFSKVSGY